MKPVTSQRHLPCFIVYIFCSFILCNFLRVLETLVLLWCRRHFAFFAEASYQTYNIADFEDRETASALRQVDNAELYKGNENPDLHEVQDVLPQDPMLIWCKQILERMPSHPRRDPGSPGSGGSNKAKVYEVIARRVLWWIWWLTIHCLCEALLHLLGEECSSRIWRVVLDTACWYLSHLKLHDGMQNASQQRLCQSYDDLPWERQC